MCEYMSVECTTMNKRWAIYVDQCAWIIRAKYPERSSLFLVKFSELLKNRSLSNNRKFSNKWSYSFI